MTKQSEEILQLTTQITTLKEQLEIKDKLVFSLEEAIPKEMTARKKYMSDIALFYETVFKGKIQHFIGLQLEELAKIGRTELGTNIIRSNISCFRLIDDWMQERTNEHMADLQDARNRVGVPENITSDLREKYKL